MLYRFQTNPLIKPTDVKPSRDDFEVIGAFNAGATIYNNQVILLLRVAERPILKNNNKIVAPVYRPKSNTIEILQFSNDDPNLDSADPRIFNYNSKTYLTSISHLRIARSNDGINFIIDEEPALVPENEYETFGLEDPRITKINNKYIITCKVVSEAGIATTIIETYDFIKFHRKGISFCPENLDVVIFPEKINNYYYALTRPVPKNIGPLAIWITQSPDLIHWGNHKVLVSPRLNQFDSARVGASCVPIKTQRGWLEIYHGADESHKYCLAAVLLDLEKPWIVKGFSKRPLMKPEADYELNGFFGNVVFACGAVELNEKLIIYYGASDESVAGAETSVKYILSLID